MEDVVTIKGRQYRKVKAIPKNSCHRCAFYNPVVRHFCTFYPENFVKSCIVDDFVYIEEPKVFV